MQLQVASSRMSKHGWPLLLLQLLLLLLLATSEVSMA
jgi:hypothetical protein